MSQGLFKVRAGKDGQLVIGRNPSSGLMLSPVSGQPLQATPLSMPLENFRDRVRALVGKEK